MGRLIAVNLSESEYRHVSVGGAPAGYIRELIEKDMRRKELRVIDSKKIQKTKRGL